MTILVQSEMQGAVAASAPLRGPPAGRGCQRLFMRAKLKPRRGIIQTVHRWEGGKDAAHLFHRDLSRFLPRYQSPRGDKLVGLLIVDRYGAWSPPVLSRITTFAMNLVGKPVLYGPEDSCRVYQRDDACAGRIVPNAGRNHRYCRSHP